METIAGATNPVAIRRRNALRRVTSAGAGEAFVLVIFRPGFLCGEAFI
jgi:hypothetical protein